MINKTETANFFWHGNPLSLYEQLCINSFIKHGFEVNVWSYMHLDLPKGANLKDAKEILSEKDLFKYSYDGKSKNLSAFSDIFRVTLLLNKPNEWWFDTDCLCLKNALEFTQLRQNKNIVISWEDIHKNRVGLGVLNMSNEDLKVKLIHKQKELLNSSNDFMWGTLSVILVTSFCKEHNLENEILPINVFYPIGYWEIEKFYNIEDTETSLKRCKDSYVCHLWNEIIKKNNIDKTVLPPKDSFLYTMFKKYLPKTI